MEHSIDRALRVLGLLGALLVGTASQAAAHCPSDSWGGLSAGIDPGTNYTATISANTNILHIAQHPFCSGNFTARAHLIGLFQACAPTTDTKHHDTLPDGGDSSTFAHDICHDLRPNYAYHTVGAHWWREHENEAYTESIDFVRYTPADNDNDGYGEDVDCDDTNSTVWDNCTDNDGDGHYWNADCNDDNAAVWQDCIVNGDPGTPIVLNLDGTGVRLSSPEEGVDFDLRPDGRKERRSWTTAESNDAWLVLDRNRNGTIDDGTELFGDSSPQPASDRPNGFVALAMFDGANEGGNADGLIDARDEIFARLRLWLDRNHDGISQASELLTLPSGAVSAISLDYKTSARQDRWGNQFTFRARVVPVRESPFCPTWATDVFLVAAKR